MVQTVLIIVLLIAIGVGYPIYLVCAGQPVTAISLVVSGSTILAVLTFIYAPYYFIFGGMALAAAFIWGVCAHEDFMYAHNFNGWGLAWLFFGFLAFGVVQRFIRHRIFDPPKRERLSFVEQLNKESHEREYNAMSPQGRETMTGLFGENYFDWPMVDSPKFRETMTGLYGSNPLNWPGLDERCSSDVDTKEEDDNGLSKKGKPGWSK